MKVDVRKNGTLLGCMRCSVPGSRPLPGTEAGEIFKEDYDKWRYHYPEFDAAQHWEKVPSEALSNMPTNVSHYSKG